MTAHIAPEGQVAAVQRVRGGESVPSVARSLGVHDTTVRNWVRHADRAQRLSILSSTPPPTPTPPAPQPAPVDAALAAAGVIESVPNPNGAPEGAPPSSPAVDASIENGKKLVDLLDVMKGVAVRGGARRELRRMRLSPQQERQFFRLSEEDRNAMELTGPFAAQYVEQYSEYVAPIGAVMFAMVYYFSIRGSIDALKEAAAEAAVAGARPVESEVVQ